MRVICLFFPALISLIIYNKRNEGEVRKIPIILYKYVIYVLINVWLTMSVVTYVFMKSKSAVESFDRFSFSTKYIAIAVVIAVLIPYMEEILKKYIEIRFEVRGKDTEDETVTEHNQ